MEEMKKYLAEAVGTMLLVVFGCGVAVATGCTGNDGIVATALAFGLVIVALAYSIGNVSGCHVNPAVSLAMYINKKITLREFLGYVIGQVIGAIVGAAVVGLLFGSFTNLGGNAVQSDVVAAYGEGGGLVIGLVAEIVLSFAFGSANTAFSKAAHIANAYSPICVTRAGIVTSDSFQQAKKAFSPIEVTPEPIERLSS